MFCLCECNQEISDTKKFAHGHNVRVSLPSNAFKKGVVPYNTGKHSIYVIYNQSRKGFDKALIMFNPKFRSMLYCDEITRKKLSDIMTKRAFNGFKPNKNKIFSKETRKKMSNVRIGIKLSNVTKGRIKEARKNQIFTPETREKLSISLKKRSSEGRWIPPYKGKIIPDVVREKISIGVKKKLEDKVWAENRREKCLKGLFIRPTSLERDVLELINKNNFEFIYTGDGSKFIGNHNPDFIHKNKQICIESRPKQTCPLWSKCSAEEYKNRQITHYEKYGWKCLIVWAEDLKENSNNIRNLIKEFSGD